MQKVFSDDSVTLFQGDAWQILQTLADDSIDGIITDPPYSSGALTLAGKQADPAKKYQSSDVKKIYPAMLGDGKDQHSFMAWEPVAVCPACLRIPSTRQKRCIFPANL